MATPTVDKMVKLLREKYPKLTDESIMHMGRLFPGKKLKDVPADHLLWWYTETDIHEKAALFNYIQENLETLLIQSAQERKNKR